MCASIRASDYPRRDEDVRSFSQLLNHIGEEFPVRRAGAAARQDDVERRRGIVRRHCGLLLTEEVHRIRRFSRRNRSVVIVRAGAEMTAVETLRVPHVRRGLRVSRWRVHDWVPTVSSLTPSPPLCVRREWGPNACQWAICHYVCIKVSCTSKHNPELPGLDWRHTATNMINQKPDTSKGRRAHSSV